MLNVHSAGKEPYLPAARLQPKTVVEILELTIGVLADLMRVVILAAIELIKLPFDACIGRGPKDISGKNVLITGGANGIGKAIALELAKLGCNIAIADVDKAASAKTLALLKKFDVKSVAISTDVADSDEVAALKETIDESFGSVDILVNNAGLMPLISLREGAPADVRRIVDVNLNANFWTIRTFIGDMLKRKSGHIVQISSMSALHPLPGATIYTATKFAVTGMMQALEEELRQDGHGGCIDFTTVYPYFVATRMDLMNTLNLRFPAITAEFTAKKTVAGIISRQRRIVIPHYDIALSALVRCLPYSIQCLVRDYILREPESRLIKDPYLYVG